MFCSWITPDFVKVCEIFEKSRNNLSPLFVYNWKRGVRRSNLRHLWDFDWKDRKFSEQRPVRIAPALGFPVLEQDLRLWAG